MHAERLGWGALRAHVIRPASRCGAQAVAVKPEFNPRELRFLQGVGWGTHTHGSFHEQCRPCASPCFHGEDAEAQKRTAERA